MSHIAVERNRRRQMNDHLKVLRSLTPCFYIKRGDQASIIGGVIEFIKELHQVLQALESKKRRKKSLINPNPAPTQTKEISFGIDHKSTNIFRELGTSCNSPLADVEAKLFGSNVNMKVVSRRRPGQLVKMIMVLEKLSFQILHINITSVDDTVLYFFVLKIGLECHISLEELALEVQKSFFPDALSEN